LPASEALRRFPREKKWSPATVAIFFAYYLLSVDRKGGQNDQR
jgi:hypothetical protein